MAKAKRTSKKSVENLEASAVDQPKAPKKMTKEYAQSVVDKYIGIDGVDIPELTEARKFLKENK